MVGTGVAVGVGLSSPSLLLSSLDLFTLVTVKVVPLTAVTVPITTGRIFIIIPRPISILPRPAVVLVWAKAEDETNTRLARTANEIYVFFVMFFLSYFID
jgi:hypothetical protein